MLGLLILFASVEVGNDLGNLRSERAFARFALALGFSDPARGSSAVTSPFMLKGTP